MNPIIQNAPINAEAFVALIDRLDRLILWKKYMRRYNDEQYEATERLMTPHSGPETFPLASLYVKR